MTRYIVRRVLVFIPTLVAVTVFIALMIDLIPGDPVELMLGMDAPGEAINKKRQELGLDRPMHVRLVDWVTHALRGDLGDSFFLSKSVTQVIVERYKVTISLAVFALVVSTVVGICAGIVASIHQGRFIDWFVTTGALIWLSIPGFWIGLNLILIFGVRLKWLPVAGFVSPTEDPIEFFRHLLLPGTALGLGYSGVMARYTRTSMLEVLRQDYMNTARAKGLVERVVLLRHALKNAMIPILTAIGIGFGGLLGGAVVTELVFNMPGVGRMVLDGVLRRDYPVVQGGLLVITLTYLLVNLLVDLSYAWADPRIRYE